MDRGQKISPRPMRISLHQNFKKRYKKLRKEERGRCDRRMELFMQNPFHPLLNNHALSGQYLGYRSINIGGDLRAIYEPISSDTAFFITLGTHPELYSS